MRKPPSASALPPLLAILAFLAALAFSAPRLSAEGFTTKDGIEFVKIEPGSFTMGSGGGHSYERPRHRVNITRAFYIGKYEVTQSQYKAVTGTSPSKHEGPDDPVECLSWDEASRFAQLVAVREGKSGFRLPTEAEWEYAARAGEDGEWPGGSSRGLGSHAWYKANSGGRHHPVGQKEPNAFGLHDTLGNVWEYVADWYDAGYYRKSPADDPKGPEKGMKKLFRGGAWPWNASNNRLSTRNYNYNADPSIYAGNCPYAPVPEDQKIALWDTDLGFRLAFSEKGVQGIT
ncbi:MAG: formylglycine-generating enzyme family protein, partial [Deltaproteobacteria bacterium]|nr:formylglycine-generating enzyme family protein [Deltaproteobacteria bacterium]